MPLTIFYDGNCPLCASEMDSLRSFDTDQKLQLEDIHAQDFSQRYPSINKKAANDILHGLNEQGELLLGLDVTVTAWRLVGKHRWLAVLRWPVIKWFADKAYLFFAKHRLRISGLLMGGRSCEADQCQVKPKTATTTRNCVRNMDEDSEF